MQPAYVGVFNRAYRLILCASSIWCSKKRWMLKAMVAISTLPPIISASASAAPITAAQPLRDVG